MISIDVKLRDGSEVSISSAAGINLMEALRDSGIDEVEALCGGCCSCATCHVYIRCSNKLHLEGVTEDEERLLSSSENRTDSSRLSCQVALVDEMDKIEVEIAPEE